MTQPTYPSAPEDPPRRNVALIVALALLAVALVVIGVLLALLLRGGGDATPAPAPGATTPAVGETATSPPTPPVTPSAPSEETLPAEPADPSTVATPGTAPTDPGPGPSGSVQEFLGDGKAVFAHFTVEQTAPPMDVEAIEGRLGFWVEVCVTRAPNPGTKTRVSLDPWSYEDTGGRKQRPIAPTAAGIYTPAFPAESMHADGECVAGFVNFEGFGEDFPDAFSLNYRNSLGDRAVWQFH